MAKPPRRPRSSPAPRPLRTTPTAAPPEQAWPAAQFAEARGDWDEAVSLYRRVARSTTAEAPWAHLRLVSIARRRGDPSPALFGMGAAARQRLLQGQQQFSSAAGAELLFARAEEAARAALERDEKEASVKSLAEMRREAENLPGTWFRARLHLIEAEVEVLTGEMASAGRAAERAQQWAERLGRPTETGMALALVGELALRGGDRALGDELCREAVRTLEGAPSRWEEARAWERWGRATEDAAGAVARLQRALARYADLEARPAIERVQIELQRRGASAGGPGTEPARRPRSTAIGRRLFATVEVRDVAQHALALLRGGLESARVRFLLVEAPAGGRRRGASIDPAEILESASAGATPAQARRWEFAFTWGRAAASGDSAFCLPLVAGERVLAAIDVESATPSALDAEARRFVQTVAGWAGPALARALRFEELAAGKDRLLAENGALRRELADALASGRVPALARDGTKPAGRQGLSHADALADFERDLFARALRSARGSIREAARTLGIARNTLRTKMRRYGLVATPEV